MQRTLPPATSLVTVLQFAPKVSLLALALVVPPVLGGSTLVGGGGAGPLGLLSRVLSGSHEGAILHEELSSENLMDTIPTMKEVKVLLRFPAR